MNKIVSVFLMGIGSCGFGFLIGWIWGWFYTLIFCIGLVLFLEGKE